MTRCHTFFYINLETHAIIFRSLRSVRVHKNPNSSLSNLIFTTTTRSQFPFVVWSPGNWLKALKLISFEAYRVPLYDAIMIALFCLLTFRIREALHLFRKSCWLLTSTELPYLAFSFSRTEQTRQAVTSNFYDKMFSVHRVLIYQEKPISIVVKVLIIWIH